MFGGTCAAVVAAIATDRVAEAMPALSSGVTTFGPSIASAVVLAAVFARHPPEGIGAFLLLDLVALTAEHWFSIDYRVIDEASVVLLMALVLVRKPTLLGRRPGWQEAALFVVVLAGVVSSLANEVGGGTWIPALLLLLKGVAFYYAVRSVDLGIGQVERVSGALLLAALVVLALGFAERLDPSAFQATLGLPPYEAERGGEPVTKSIFLHPALFGWLTAFTSLFLYARFAVLRSWWALALGVVCNIGTVLSFRRRPLLGIVTGLTAIGFAEWRRSGWFRPATRWVVGGVAVLLVLAVMAAPAIGSTVDRTIAEYLGRGDPLEILAEDPRAELVKPTQARVALYFGAVAIARDHFPLGAGLGRYGSFISRVNYSPEYGQYELDHVAGLTPDRPVAATDTYWAMILGETGVIGLIATSVFLGLILLKLWRLTTLSSIPGAHAFTLGALAVFVEGLVGSATASTFVAGPIAFWVFGAAAVAEALVRSGGSGTREEQRESVTQPATMDSSMIRHASATPSQPKTSTRRSSSSL